MLRTCRHVCIAGRERHRSRLARKVKWRHCRALFKIKEVALAVINLLVFHDVWFRFSFFVINFFWRRLNPEILQVRPLLNRKSACVALLFSSRRSDFSDERLARRGRRAFWRGVCRETTSTLKRCYLRCESVHQSIDTRVASLVVTSACSCAWRLVHTFFARFCV